MERKFEKIEKGLNEIDVDKVFFEGITCCAEVEVGECVDCLLSMFEGMKDAQLVTNFKKVLGPDKEKYVDEFLALLLLSEVATITNNFKDREAKGSVGEA